MAVLYPYHLKMLDLLQNAHIQYLTEHAVDPDKRRYAVDGEAARHYIDLDHFGLYPFDELPQKVGFCRSQFMGKIHAYGLWQSPLASYRCRCPGNLKMAFEEGNPGSYTQDCQLISGTMLEMLMCRFTRLENYNGQLTGQKGIHGFWESSVCPNYLPDHFDFFVGRAFYIEDVLMESWQAVLESHLRTGLCIGCWNANYTRHFPPDKKYGYENRNNVVVRVYSREYATAYHRNAKRHGRKTYAAGYQASRLILVHGVADGWFARSIQTY